MTEERIDSGREFQIEGAAKENHGVQSGRIGGENKWKATNRSGLMEAKSPDLASEKPLQKVSNLF